jgi:hypothetical protein
MSAGCMLNPRRMRVLLRKITNGFYLQGGGGWVSNPEKAFDFGSIQHAIEFVSETRADSAQLELALAFEGTKLISPVSLKTALESSGVAHLGSGVSAPGQRTTRPS